MELGYQREVHIVASDSGPSSQHIPSAKAGEKLTVRYGQARALPQLHLHWLTFGERRVLGWNWGVGRGIEDWGWSNPGPLFFDSPRLAKDGELEYGEL